MDTRHKLIVAQDVTNAPVDRDQLLPTAMLAQRALRREAITVFADRSFSFITKSPPAAYFLKKAAKLEKGAQEPGRETAGYVTRSDVREIAEKKMDDLNAYDIEGAMKMIEGSARSMGIEVRE